MCPMSQYPNAEDEHEAATSMLLSMLCNNVDSYANAGVANLLQVGVLQ